MHLYNKTILIVSPEPYNGLSVSKHHYARHLAQRGNEVYFLAPPYGKYNRMKTEINGLFLIQYSGFPKGLRFYPKFLQNHFTQDVFKKIEALIKKKIDMIWSFDNSVFYDLHALPERVFKISHIVDLNQNFQFKEASEGADLCLAVHPEILKKQKDFNNNCHLITHGLNVRNLDNIARVTLPGNLDIKAIYIGNLNMPHIDWELMDLLSEEFKMVDFIFLGSYKDSIPLIDSLLNRPNIHCMPPVNSTEIFTYLISSDFQLALYKESYFSDYASPHKMLEYFYSGKSIISTFIKEYEGLNDLILMAKNHNNYLKNVHAFLESPSKYNNEEKAQRRREFALKNSYHNKIEKIESLIADSVQNRSPK